MVVASVEKFSQSIIEGKVAINLVAESAMDDIFEGFLIDSVLYEADFTGLGFDGEFFNFREFLFEICNFMLQCGAEVVREQFGKMLQNISVVMLASVLLLFEEAMNQGDYPLKSHSDDINVERGHWILQALRKTFLQHSN